MQKLIIIGIVVCLVVRAKAQSCCGSPCMMSGNENILSFTTLSKKKIVTDIFAEYTQFKHFHYSDNSSNSHSGHDHNHNNSTNNNTNNHIPLQNILLSTAQVRYGLHDRLTLHAQMPLWLVNSDHKHTLLFGDVPLLASLKVVQTENYGIGVTAGTELPTGNNYIVFENNYLITGSGSFDPVLGASFWFKYKKLLTRIQTQYKQGMKGFDNIHFGSNLNTQWTVAYYVKGLDTESKFKLNLNTGLNQDWINAHILNGKFIDNTGSFILWYNAGTQIQYKKWIFPLSFIVPVYTQVRGVQNEPFFRMKTGVTLLVN